MPRAELRKTLEELKTELLGTERLDAETRDLVAAVMGEMNDVLIRSDSGEDPSATPTEATGDDASVIQRVEHAVEHLEEEHPKVAVLLGNLVTALKRMGF